MIIIIIINSSACLDYYVQYWLQCSLSCLLYTFIAVINLLYFMSFIKNLDFSLCCHHVITLVAKGSYWDPESEIGTPGTQGTMPSNRPSIYEEGLPSEWSQALHDHMQALLQTVFLFNVQWFILCFLLIMSSDVYKTQI